MFAFESYYLIYEMFCKVTTSSPPPLVSNYIVFSQFQAKGTFFILWFCFPFNMGEGGLHNPEIKYNSVGGLAAAAAPPPTPVQGWSHSCFLSPTIFLPLPLLPKLLGPCPVPPPTHIQLPPNFSLTLP